MPWSLRNYPASTSIPNAEKKTWSRFRLRSSREVRENESKWQPNALRPTVLIVTAGTCWAAIAILQTFLIRSDRDQGILFASSINDLPLRQTFLFRYLPTIIAVVYSILWSWIDLETKRLEPYYQLSKHGGALGKDSLLLHYPFDFIPLVPVSALRKRHWTVFFAATAVLLVTWGLVPTQAGIFATVQVDRLFSAQYAISAGYVPAEKQETNMTLDYAQSTYAIVALNETLPPFMTKDYLLAPFKPAQTRQHFDGTWTSSTTLYSVDLHCEMATQGNATDGRSYSDSHGCETPYGLSGNITSNITGDLYETKQYSGMFIGYWNYNGFADYYLDGDCPRRLNHTFYAGMARNKNRKQDPPHNTTSMFCTPFYYSQTVKATVDAASQYPKNITLTGAKQPLASDIYNTTLFEALLNGGTQKEFVRGAMPTRYLPSYANQLSAMNISLVNGNSGGTLQPFQAMATIINNRTLEELMDPDTLKLSYESAYRLLFVRSMVQVLDQSYSITINASGEIKYSSQAVVLVPLFTYLVEGLLAVVSIFSLCLLFSSSRRPLRLKQDPSTIASLMALVAESEPLLAHISTYDGSSTEKLQEVLRDRKFELVDDGHKVQIMRLDGSAQQDNTPPMEPTWRLSASAVPRPIRPRMFRLVSAVSLLCLYILLAIGLLILYGKSQLNGLPLPCANKIGQNFLENYIPTIIATLIEPVWILVNRLLCMFQPIEELRTEKAVAKKSINLDYSSLPPQLVIWKALRSGHIVLAAVCFMALLANLLAISFSGLFNQEFAGVIGQSSFPQILQPKVVSASQWVTSVYEAVGTQNDQFLIAESNYTRSTILPAWTDGKLMYPPLHLPSAGEDLNTVYRMTSMAGVAADLECLPLKHNINITTGFGQNEVTQAVVTLNTTIPIRTSSAAQCNYTSPWYSPCPKGRSAMEIVSRWIPGVNATQQEKDECGRQILIGWLRKQNETCPSTVDETNSFFLSCQPRIITGSGNIKFDGEGHLLEPATNLQLELDQSAPNDDYVFEGNATGSIQKINEILLGMGVGASWHNDSFASDGINYFIMKSTNSSRLLDPDLPLPTLGEVIGPLQDVYSRLFAIWLSVNREKLLVPYQQGSEPLRVVTTITQSERLFLSTPMVIIAEAILMTYAVVTVLVYLRRPGQYLVRLPTSIANVVALFAASAAVLDMKGTSYLTKKKRGQFLKQLDSRYGYGNYIGGDGKAHLGIEKFPFVRTKRVETWLEKTWSSLRKRK